MKTEAQRVREQGQAAKWVNGSLLHLLCQPTPRSLPACPTAATPPSEPDGSNLILQKPVGGGASGGESH